MRTWIIGAAAMLALAAVPGVAAAQATGYVGAAYSSTDDNGPGDNADAWGVEGAVAFAGSSSISFEVDAAWATSDDDDNDTASIAGHVYSRNDSHLLGAFVGMNDSDATDTTWFVGAEGAIYMDRVTLGASVAYGNNDDNDIDAWGVQGNVRYFPMDNFRLDGNIGWANIDYGAGDDDAWFAGVGGEYQFDALPISIGLGYQHAELDDADQDVDSWTVRLRYNWGGSLFDRDRHGASQADQVGFIGLL